MDCVLPGMVVQAGFPFDECDAVVFRVAAQKEPHVLADAVADAEVEDIDEELDLFDGVRRAVVNVTVTIRAEATAPKRSLSRPTKSLPTA